MKTLNYNGLSIILPSKSSSDFIVAKVKTLYEFLKANYSAPFEIVVALNGDHAEILDCYRFLNEKYSNLDEVILHKHYAPAGKGAAIRSAFLKTKYAMISFIDSDLPFNLDFLLRAIEQINRGHDLVTGNRRLEKSVFQIPVPVLQFAYKRHVAGLLFNSCLKFLFPIRVRDTQCGIKLMSRKFATGFFESMNCPGFSFDIEMFLYLHANHLSHRELPVTLKLNSEKTNLRLMIELFRSIKWLFIFKRKEFLNDYSESRNTKPIHFHLLHINADDWGISPGVNEGILKLAQRGIVTRVSLFANTPFLEYSLNELLSIPNLKFGLHFNLTNGKPIGKDYKKIVDRNGHFLDLNKYLFRCLFGLKRLPLKTTNEIKNEFTLQMNRLHQLHIPVTFFDGHQHIHLFPGVIRCLRKYLETIGIKNTRSLVNLRILFSKKFLLWFLSIRAQKNIQATGLKTLPIRYPNQKHYRYFKYFTALLNVDKETEVITHPAVVGDLSTIPIENRDSYDGPRVQEFWSLSRFDSLKRKVQIKDRLPEQGSQFETLTPPL